jgi:hypothetical protein
MFKAFGGKCFYSGRKVDWNNFEIDHVLPKSSGGEDCIYNYVLADKEINNKKSDNKDFETINKILYIVSTAYAPKVMELLGKLPLKKIDSNIQYFIDNGYDEKKALELKERWVSSGGSLAETMFCDIHGGLMFGITESIAELDSIDQMECMYKYLISFAEDIKEIIKEHISDNEFTP